MRSFIIAIVFIGICMSSIQASPWEYVEKITNKGSRSEGKQAFLKYKGKNIPGKLGQIITPKGSYQYINSYTLWGFNGWQHCKDISYNSSSEVCTEKILKQGHYKGDKLQNTPDSWCYIPRYKLWIDAENIHEYCRKELKFDPGAAADMGVSPVLISFDKLKKAISTGWEYTHKITNPGTRSQGKIGYLKYNGFEIPGKAEKIVTEKGYFKFMTSHLPWEYKGWKKIEAFDLPADPKKVFENGLKWYAGAKRKNTPAHWCYIEKYNGWVDPEHLQEFFKTQLKDVKEKTENKWDEIFGK